MTQKISYMIQWQINMKRKIKKKEIVVPRETEDDAVIWLNRLGFAAVKAHDGSIVIDIETQNVQSTDNFSKQRTPFSNILRPCKTNSNFRGVKGMGSRNAGRIRS